MRLRFRSSFIRDLKKVRDPAALAGARNAIEPIEEPTSVGDIDQLCKLSGASGHYRMRVGD